VRLELVSNSAEIGQRQPFAHSSLYPGGRIP
jgi:hypothetical protein